MSDECERFTLSRRPNTPADRSRQQLRERTTRYALAVIRLCGGLGRWGPENVIGRQLVRSGTSVGAQYREACRARSPAEFVSKLESALQELEETGYLLELLERSELIDSGSLADLRRETDELTAMLTASVHTAKRRNTSRKA